MAATGLETADAEFLTDIKRMSWTILAASSLSSSARLLEPPLWVFNPPGVEPFDAAWNNFRLVTSLSGVLLIVFLLVGGLLGDLYGRRRIWMIGLVGFIVCNLLIMAFPGLAWRIVLQFCALAFGSLFAPLILATLNLTFPDRSRTLAFAIFVSVNAIALQLAWLQGQFLSAIRLARGLRSPDLGGHRLGRLGVPRCARNALRRPAALRNVRLQRLDARGSRHGLWADCGSRGL